MIKFYHQLQYFQVTYGNHKGKIMDLSGNTALITGGGIRLGRAISLALARVGCNVAIHFNSSREKAIEVKQQAVELGVKAEIFQFNLSDFSDVE